MKKRTVYIPKTIYFCTNCSILELEIHGHNQIYADKSFGCRGCGGSLSIENRYEKKEYYR